MEETSQLQDTFGRVHNYLRISLTENCNLRCTYCMPEEGIQLTPKSHIMTEDEIFEIASTFVNFGVNKIRLTGGEPLVRKDAKSIIKKLATLPVELTLTTNGLLVHEFINTFKEAGIKSVNVSIDSLQKDKYTKITRRDKLELLLSNIQLLINNNIQVKLNVVLIKELNEDEILDFIELTKCQNIQIRFIEFMPFDGNQWDKRKLVSQDDILQEILTKFNKVDVIRLEDKKNDTARNYKISNYFGSFAIISSVTNPFCDSCNRIRLTADGKLKNCLFSNTETSLLDELRAGHSLIPLIKQNINLKLKTRGGLVDNEMFYNPTNISKNRSMIAIGG